MRVWTTGSTARLWVGDTLYRLRGGLLTVEEKLSKKEAAQEAAAIEVVASGPGGARLEGSLTAKRRKVYDAVALGAARVAAVIAEGRGGPRLVIGPPAGPFELDLPLEAEAPRIDWPGSVIWAPGKAPWSEATAFSGIPQRGIRLHQNEQGIAIAAAISGHVAVLRPGARELAFVARVPGQLEAHLDAVPTRQGALVTLSVAARQSAVLHLSEGGEILGRWPERFALRSFPALRLTDDLALAADTQEDALVLLSLPGLEEIAREMLGETIIEAAAVEAGDWVVLGSGTSVFEVEVDAEGLSIEGPYELKEARPAPSAVEEPTLSYDPERATGPAQIAFPALSKSKDPPWTATLGGETTLVMHVRSGAGAGRGLRVELGGPAIQEGLVGGLRARLGDVVAELTREGPMTSVTLAGVEIPEGLEWPLEPQPETSEEKAHARELLAATHLSVEITLGGLKAGSALLSVALSVPKSSASPLKRIRPVTVS